jgi:glutamate-1-semialdehyde aminotransferase
VGIARAIADATSWRVQRVGSMLTVFFRRDAVRSWGRFFVRHEEVRIVARGSTRARCLLATVAIRSCLRSAAHGPDDVAKTVEAATLAFEAVT